MATQIKQVLLSGPPRGNPARPNAIIVIVGWLVHVGFPIGTCKSDQRLCVQHSSPACRRNSAGSLSRAEPLLLYTVGSEGSKANRWRMVSKQTPTSKTIPIMVVTMIGFSKRYGWLPIDSCGLPQPSSHSKAVKFHSFRSRPGPESAYSEQTNQIPRPIPPLSLLEPEPILL